MEKEKRLPVIVSHYFLEDLEAIFNHGLQTFGKIQAARYESEIWELIDQLPSSYLLFPECRHLPTKSKIYRWIILEAHVIIYRIRRTEIQVLRIFHSKRSISTVKTSRSTRIH